MSRRQLPPQIRKVTVTDRATAKTVVRYQVTVDAGSDPITGRRRQARRRFDTERAARSRVQAGAGSVVENEPKTLSSCRTLPLDEGLVAVLKRASVRYAQDRLALGAAHADSGYVAVNEAGEPYTPDTLTRMWHKLAESAGVRPIRLHDTRHSCGTALRL